ncbi:MAG: DUF4129 domain-containing protein, partial [Clostridia bacterium]|nr:DUF4129 domain-containing protein [Clostridia bacterium]
SRTGKIVLLLLLILLLLSATAAFVYVRLSSTSPERMAKRQKQNEDKLMYWYRAMLTALEAGRIRYEAGETPLTFARRALERGGCTEEFIRFSMIVSMRRYSESDATNEDFRVADDAYRGIRHLMKLPSRFRWYARRILRGIGHVKQVP